jgi:hypothetical protein
VEDSYGSVPNLSPGRRIVKRAGIILGVLIRRKCVLAIALVISGVGVLALPSSLEGPQIVHFGPGHGPSLVDMVGIALVVPGGIWLLALIVGALPSLDLSARSLFGMGAAGGAGLGLTVASVFADFTAWWIVGLSLVTLVEAVLLITMWRRA